MPRFDPRRHHRRSIRLPGWDYTTPAIYFVTICTYNRDCLFAIPEWAMVAETAWREIPKHAGNVQVDEWILMPNHLHGLLVLTDETGDTPLPSFNLRWSIPHQTAAPRLFANAPSGSLGSLVRSYKAAVTNRINHQCHSKGCPRWQRGYYDRIVRDDREMDRIRVYIRHNPIRWQEDRDNLDELLERMTYHDA